MRTGASLQERMSYSRLSGLPSTTSGIPTEWVKTYGGYVWMKNAHSKLIAADPWHLSPQVVRLRKVHEKAAEMVQWATIGRHGWETDIRGLRTRVRG
jgi:hypothetical protein